MRRLQIALLVVFSLLSIASARECFKVYAGVLEAIGARDRQRAFELIESRNYRLTDAELKIILIRPFQAKILGSLWGSMK